MHTVPTALTRRIALAAVVVLAAVACIAVGAAALEGRPVTVDAVGPDAAVTTLDRPPRLTDATPAEQEEENEDGENGGEAGPSVVPEWWGLDGEATEAAYIGLVELGVTVLVAGVGGYSAGKRLSLVPARHRLRLLQAHEWTVLAGTALTVPHFLFAGEWEGLGLLVGVLLGAEVLSGLYGRHLHRHVVRLGRGDETPALAGRFLETSNRVLFGRWRRVHVSLTLVTALAVVLHVVTAVGD